MQSGFPDFYTNGRSMNAVNYPAQFPYSRSQLPGLFFNSPTSQIANQTPTTLIGKRTLAEFQSQQQYLPNNNNVHGLLPMNYLRSVKPRNYQQPSSLISPMEFSSNSTDSSSSSITTASSQQQRFVWPVLQQLRPQQHISQTLPGVQYMSPVQNRVVGIDSEKKAMMMNHRLQELEKQLLDDNDEVEGDTISVITNTNSAWSETIQNLIGTDQSPNPNLVSASPTSSSSSSSSGASPASVCSKQSLMEAATAISDGKTEIAAEILTRLTQVSNQNLKPSSEQRVIQFIASALKSRVNPIDNPPPPVSEFFGEEHAASTQLLYDLSPCFKLGLVAANHSILEATLTDQANCKVHVVDFDIGYGGQFVHLLHALSVRCQNGRSIVLKITTVAADDVGEERLKMLSQLAESLGVRLEFNNVKGQKLAELSRESIGCVPGELLAINFAFKLYRMPDESVSMENPRDELLRRVKGLAPTVVTMVEQELNTNTAPFLARVKETYSYYLALLESAELTVSDRAKVEKALSQKLANSVACEGKERIERCEVFGKWRARMRMAGFELKPVSQNIAESISNRLNSGFTVKEENGGLCFGWMGRTLTVASAWR